MQQVPEHDVVQEEVKCEKCRWWLLYGCKCVKAHCRRGATPGSKNCKYEPRRYGQ